MWFIYEKLKFRHKLINRSNSSIITKKFINKKLIIKLFINKLTINLSTNSIDKFN